jgi:phage recombination protein Bet
VSTEIVQAGGALAIRPDQTEWTPAQAAVLQQSGISEDVTAAELSGFLHLCQRTQLDPFSRQIYLIGRKDKRAGRNVFTPQTGIDGYRVIAHRVVAESKGSFGYEDTQWCDTSGRWRDVWLSSEPPAAARVTVVRNGHRFPAIALYREYVQTAWENKPSGLWGKMPAGQLAKCAEALALRKAFPHDLAGVYTAEEMAQADNPEPEVRQQQASVRPLRPVSSATGAQQAAEDAAHTTDAEVVRRIFRTAGPAGLLDAPVQTPLGGMTLREYLAARGGQLTAVAEPVDAEVVEDDGRTAAVDALRGAALAAGVADTIERDFLESYGVDISRAEIEKLAEMTELLRGAA